MMHLCHAADARQQESQTYHEELLLVLLINALHMPDPD